MKDPGPILVTGASGGIGGAISARLVRAKRTVYASARDPKALGALLAMGCRTIALDVTDEDSCRSAITTITAEAGPLGVLVNNAGFGVYGPVEQVDLDDVRREFETNVFGAARLIQLALPVMRDAGRGRIVNISSVSGRVSSPGGAFYQASKFALEAMSDTLRYEVAPFNIGVVLVEPGPVRTRWAEVTAASVPLETDAAEDGSPDPYAGYKQMITGMLLAPPAARDRVSVSADRVARTVARAIRARRPRTRYVVGVPMKVLVTLRRVLPDRAFDALLQTRFPWSGSR